MANVSALFNIPEHSTKISLIHLYYWYNSDLHGHAKLKFYSDHVYDQIRNHRNNYTTGAINAKQYRYLIRFPMQVVLQEVP